MEMKRARRMLAKQLIPQYDPNKFDEIDTTVLDAFDDISALPAARDPDRLGTWLVGNLAFMWIAGGSHASRTSTTYGSAT